jgi:hypothetical protein
LAAVVEAEVAPAAADEQRVFGLDDIREVGVVRRGLYGKAADRARCARLCQVDDVECEALL